MTDTPKRRFEDHFPAEPLDWEDPEAKAAKEHTRLANAMATAGAQLLEHTNTAAALAAIPNSAPQQYVVAGTLAMIAKVLPAEPVPPLTAPAPLTYPDVVREAIEATFEQRPGYLAKVAAAVRALAAPAPQQSELTDATLMYEIEMYFEANANVSDECDDFLDRINKLRAAKAAPAAPVQTAEEVLALHRQLAAEKLRADQGWARAEAKSTECIELRERMAAPVQAEQARAKLVMSVTNTESTVYGCDWDAVPPGIYYVYTFGAPALPAQAEQAAAVRAAFEKAAHLCETIGTDWLEADDANKNFAADYLAKQIRALIAPSTGESSKGESA